MAITINGSIVQSTPSETAYAKVNARLDSIIADGQQTQGNTELIDIRTGADNITYQTAGTAVRSQFTNLTNRLDSVQDDISTINSTLSEEIVSVQHDISTINSTIDNHDDSIGNLSNTVSGHTSDISNLSDRIDSVQNDISDLSERIGSVEDDVMALPDRIGDDEVRIGNLEFQVDAAEDGIRSAQSDITDINETLTANDTKYKELLINSNTCSIFKKVCFCGDDFMSGYIHPNGTFNPSRNNPGYSWVHYLSQITGGEYINCGVSGASSKTWLLSTDGISKMQASGKAQAYVIAFGVNDSDTYGDNYLPVGTPFDIGTNENTYYAKMSKIMRECYNVNPDAEIFFLTCPDCEDGLYNSSRYDEYNNAIKAIVGYYLDKAPNVHYIDLADKKELFTAVASLTDDRQNQHYTAVGYQQIARIIGKIWSDYINANVYDFRNVYTIPYDSENDEKYNFTVAQGDTWVETLEIKNADGTEHQYDSSEIVRFALSTSRSADDVIITKTLEYDTINHEYVIILSAAETATLTADSVYYFDIGLQSGTTYTRLIQCQELKVIPGISRAVNS